MYMVSYKFCSKNTLAYYSLHDCICSKMFFDGCNIVLDMEWMEVLSGHPNNPYNKAHQSTEGRIILEKPSLDKCTLLPWDGKKEPSRELSLEEVDVSDFEVLSFDEEAEQNSYKLMLYGELHDSPRNAEYAFIEMVVHYSSSQDMFNELVRESWFEDEP